MPKKEHLTKKNHAGNSAFVDTSAWIALFSRRDQHHREADRIFRVAVSSKWKLLTTNLILAETHRLILQRVGIKAAAAALAKIQASPLVRIEFESPAHHESAKSWLEKFRDFRISYTDAVSFAVMEASDCREAIAYDQHFRLAGFSQLK